MGNWVDKYKSLIFSSHKQNVIITDIDNLFLYAELPEALEDEGFAVLIAESDLDVRILFESHVRGSDGKCLIVSPTGYMPLPDILQEVLFYELGLKELFPNLDRKALKGLDFNALCTLSNIKPNEELGYNSTIIFLLENLFNIDFTSFNTSRSKEKILNALITVFNGYGKIGQPVVVFLADQAKPYFPDLISNGLTTSSLNEFIQSVWNDYAADHVISVDILDPILVKNIGYLFIEEILQPVLVSHERFNRENGALRIGLKYDLGEPDRMKLQSFNAYLSLQANDISDNYDEWFALIQVLSKAMNLATSLDKCDESNDLANIILKLNERFQRFIDNTYWSLFSLSGIRKPVVVARILDYLKAQSEKKKALIVLDGMNFWQWEIIADRLMSSGIESNSKVTMAFIPTITAWSRQAIFRGNKPNLNEDNSKEEKLFKEYWRIAGYQDYQVLFKRFNVDHLLKVNEISGLVEIVGTVCNDLDDIMHGSILGNKELASDTLQWIEKINFIETIKALKEKGFKCYITSDHGNVESKGVKNLSISEKVGAISRGQRHIQFSNDIMLKRFQEHNPEMNYGLRDNSVFLRDQYAFRKNQSTVITHGGSHLWEVLIPFIEI